MSLFAHTAAAAALQSTGGAPGAQAIVEVPGFWQDAGPQVAMQPIRFPAPVIPSPADDNIQPAQGDDTTAPNATTAARLNRIVCVSNANVGYSKAAKDKRVLPSALEYEAFVEEAATSGEFALTLRMIMEFESSFPDEGMVVWMKKQQQVINDEALSELMLIETSFEDWAGGRWVPISTDVRYAEEAEAVVQAVITTDSGQTAGRVTQTGSVEDAKLGPVGEKGRIILTYRCERLYSYGEMSLGPGNAATGARTLVPVALQLPWAAIDNPGSHCRISATVQAPLGASLLDPATNVLAFRDLQRSLAGEHGQEASSQCAVLPKPGDGMMSDVQAGGPTWSFSRTSLPPRPTLVLAWLSMPEAVDQSWEKVESALPKATQARLMLPKGQDARLLRVAQPGGLEASLVRCRIDTEAPPRSPNVVRVHTDIVISDASGSTGMTVKGAAYGVGSSVRAHFNKYEARRLLKRLESIPRLRSAGVLLDQDVWCQLFVVFDHGTKAEFSIETRVADLDAATVGHLCKALDSSDVASEAALQQAGKKELLERWRAALTQLKDITPGGATSFVVGTKKATANYTQAVRSKFPSAELTAYVNFDTDGGNNCGQCYDAISELLAEADVVQGHVLGIGSWVDQDCAAKVAKLLKGSASLSVSFPEDAAADEFFRQDLSRWIKVLRTSPVSITVSAGSMKWAARHGERLENGVECLFAEAEGVRFDGPDVSESDHTKAVLRGLRAGESATLYLLSRLPLEQLASSLRIDVGGVKASVAVGAEQICGVPLGHRWLSLLGASSPPEGLAVNRSCLCTRLRHRLEDDLSFAWNLPTKSGSTAAVGRASTVKRMPVSKDQQPEEPLAPCADPPVRARDGLVFGGGGGFGGGKGGGGLFGGGGGMGGGFGGNIRGATASLSMGAPPRMAQMRCAAAGPPAPAPAPGGGLFGAPPPAMMACQAAAPFGASAPSASAAPPLRRKAKESKCMKKVVRSAFADDDDDDVDGDGGKTPGAILRSSGFMRFGTGETPLEAIARGVKAAKHLAKSTLDGLSPLQTVAGVQGIEDPLVGDILGAAPRAVGPGAGAVHAGFVCDGSGINPLTGVRYKATTAYDHDISEACRRNGTYAGGAGFRAIASADVAMRWLLASALTWWQVVWRTRSDLFQTAFPDLNNLSTAALCQAIMNLPDALAVGDFA